MGCPELTTEYYFRFVGESKKPKAACARSIPKTRYPRFSHIAVFGHRFYSPNLGRWISRDPIEEKGGYNLYGFCDGNPIKLFDYLGYLPIQRQPPPKGLFCECSKDKCTNTTNKSQIAILLKNKKVDNNDYKKAKFSAEFSYNDEAVYKKHGNLELGSIKEIHYGWYTCIRGSDLEGDISDYLPILDKPLNLSVTYTNHKYINIVLVVTFQYCNGKNGVKNGGEWKGDKLTIGDAAEWNFTSDTPGDYSGSWKWNDSLDEISIVRGYSHDK